MAENTGSQGKRGDLKKERKNINIKFLTKGMKFGII